MSPLRDTPPELREELYPIRTVAALTGVKPVTLRAWERRHALVCPQRAPSGHRLYTRADLDRLRRAAALVEQGVPIGRVRALLDAPPAPGAGRAPQLPDAPAVPVWEACIARLLAAVVRFDEVRLNAVYNEALTLYPVDLVHEHAITPLMGLLGERWSQHRGGIAEEHFFSNYLRNKLGARSHHLSPAAGGRVLVTACLPDERHDLGLLMFSHGACARGHRVVMLGAAVPLRELIPALLQAGADAMVLSAVMPPSPAVLAGGLPELVREAPVPVLVGGPASQPYAAAIEAAGAAVLGDDVSCALVRIERLLGAARPAPS
jgi:DNA-binding transcriptional MerR regulator